MPFYESRNRTLEISRINNFIYPLHMHREVEIIYAYEGRISLHIDGEAYNLEEGDVAIAFPNVIHGFLPVEGGAGKGMFISFPPELSQDYGADISKRRPFSPIIRRADMHPEVPMLLKMALDESEAGQDIAVLKAYMALVLARLMPVVNLSVTNEYTVPGKLYSILSYLSEHCTEQITLESLADQFNLSVSYISHVFSDTMRINFRTYLNTLRLRRALVMLWSTDSPITRICFDCGFESQRTFNRAFREQYGQTPSDFRTGRGSAPQYHYKGLDTLPAIQAVPSLRVQV